ncbi:MAG: DNA gyrase inhibitor YacG [Alteromonadaceae bacterium]|nr:MAG: DNA gyrase inhibitor YacG [Alteromonadaceae bacterium]
MNKKTLSVNCPVCEKKVLMNEKSPQRPFCSPRCKLIDLGDWADEKHAISGNSVEEAPWSDDLENY